jgi:hypothetical protein
MEMTGPIIAIEPVLDKGGTARRIARLEEAMSALMRRVGIARIGGERSLDQTGAGRDISGLDVGPAEIAKKPPIVTPMRRQCFEQRQLRLMVIAPSAEAQ